MKGLIAIIAALVLASPAAAGQQKRLDTARDHWAGQATKDYRFRLEVSCFCRDQHPYTLTVRDGKPVDPPAGARGATTVPRLFRIIQRAIDGHYDKLEVTYGKRGLPRRIFVNPDADLADGSTTYLASRFHGL